MPTLEECMEQIGELVKEKGFQTDLLFFKLAWGQIELAEAMDLIKKNGLPDIKIDGSGRTWESVPFKIGEEIIDVVFYMCDAYRLLRRKYPELHSMDEMFEYKMQKNLNRPSRYGQGWIKDFMRSTVDHMNDEGVLDDFILDIIGYANEKKMKKHDPDRVWPPDPTTSSFREIRRGWPAPTKEAYAPVRLGGKKPDMYDPQDYVVCTVCSGTGETMVDGRYENCNHCDGSGTVYLH